MKCLECNQEKPDTEFKQYKRRSKGIIPKCFDCKRKLRQLYNERTGYKAYHKYEKTHKGFLMRLYRNMDSRINGVQKAKHHLYKGKYLLGREDFYNWALNCNEFFVLFENYKNYNYNRKFAPSVDRIDSSKGYTIDNMEWVTHSENSRRGANSKQRKLPTNVV